MLGSNDRGKPTTNVKVSSYNHVARVTRMHKIIEDLVCDRLIKNALLPECLEIVF